MSSKVVLAMLSCLLLLSGCITRTEKVTSQKIKVNPSGSCIVLPAKPTAKQKMAAKELAYHLKLITGTDVPIGKKDNQKYQFKVGIAPIAGKHNYSWSEAVYKVTPDCTYFFGDTSGPRGGSLFAVYNFLGNELGLRWISPGEENIAFTKRATLELTVGGEQWTTDLKSWGIRSRVVHTNKNALTGELASLAMTDKEFKKLKGAVALWAQRMCYNSHGGLWYGHAFTNWWKKYGKTHPEYFALQPDGKRWPGYKRRAPEVKICPSNSAVIERIVQDWRDRGKPSNANACENDMSFNFCCCDKCRALDVPGPELPFFKHYMTDRYIHLTNQVARKVAAEKPGTKVVTYAYNETEYPPRREKVDPNIIIGYVPTCFELDKYEKAILGWRKAGMSEWFLRPNINCYFFTGTIPIGMEKHAYELIKIAQENGCTKFDFDSYGLNFGVYGFIQYVMSRTMYEPGKSFEYWAGRYYSAFGDAAPEVQAYYELYRNIWNKRLAPNLGKIAKRGKVFNFTRGLYWTLGDYYNLKDFEKAEAILNEAAKKQLTPQQKQRLQQLQLINKHAKLVFLAVTTKVPEKFKYSRELLAFRLKYGRKMEIYWPATIWAEKYWGDITGIVAAGNFEAYDLPWLETPLFWHFKLDPKNVGLKEKFNELSLTEMINKGWELMPTNSAWENPHAHYKKPSKVLRDKLKKYDGIGWYSTALNVPTDWKKRNVYLYFGAVDESCRVFVNGKLVHERIMSKPDDWTTPFEVNITDYINWQQPKQQITVRVEDKGGAGGIWKRVWLVSSKQRNK